MKTIFTILVLISFLGLGKSTYCQTKVFTHPDKILHLSSQDSSSYFGAPMLNDAYLMNTLVKGNINNDAYDDIIVIAPDGKNPQGVTVGITYIYLGSPTGIGTTPSQIIYGNRSVAVPHTGCVLGDFNHDGHADIVIGYEGYNVQGSVTQGYAACFFGKADNSGIDTTQRLLFEGLSNSGNFAHAIVKGDMNGDGTDDLIISAIHDGEYAGRIYCYFGGSSMDAIPDLMFSRSGSTILGYVSLKVADINGDGLDDIVTLDMPGWNGCNLQVDVFAGNAVINLEPSFFKGFNGMNFLQATDINGDGFADVIGTSNNGLNCSANSPYKYITVIKGRANYSMDSTVLIPFLGELARPSNLINSVDVNNDGIKDVFISIKKSDGSIESYVFAGHPTQYINTLDTLFKFVDSDGTYGNTIENIIPADCNGDGKPEFYGYSQMLPYKGVIFVYENIPQIEKIFFAAKPSSGNFYSIYSMNTDATNRVKLFNDN
ncbi:MAG: FG-GAP repeat domain-containing protein, partial [Bacteroidales bacterium]